MAPAKTPRDTEIIPALSEEDEKRLDRAYKLADRPEEFARLFCEVAGNQTVVQKKIETILKELLNRDIQARESLKKIIKEVEKENFHLWFKSMSGKIGIGIWTLIVVLFTAWVGKFFK